MRGTLDFINAMYAAIQIAGSFMQFMILMRVVFSWLNIRPKGFLTRFIYNITELILLPIRNLINKMGVTAQTVRLDFSPLVAILFLQVFNGVLLMLIQLLAAKFYG